jgi:hypothetical protein
MICTGCGLELPPGTGRGRPALFHNGTCRQRARRARLVSKHAEILTAVGVVEAAVSELRRIVLASNAPSTDAGRVLEQATAALTSRLRDATAPAPSTPETLPEAAMSPTGVTQTVTETPEVPTEAAIREPRVTESVTKESGDPIGTAPAAPTRTPRGRAGNAQRRTCRTGPLDLDTVRLERRGAGERGWRVLAGAETAPILLGFVEPVYSLATGRRSGRWDAVTDDRHKLLGGPWRDRTDAILRLVESYEQAARNPRRRHASAAG